jgi:hypothetical protein
MRPTKLSWLERLLLPKLATEPQTAKAIAQLVDYEPVYEVNIALRWLVARGLAARVYGGFRLPAPVEQPPEPEQPVVLRFPGTRDPD